MEETFEAIGLEVPSEKDFNHLAERAGDQGEPSLLPRRGRAPVRTISANSSTS